MAGRGVADAYAVYSLGIVQQTRGRLDEAAASYSAAWSSFQRTADRRGQAQARYGMGAICQEQGLPARALEHFHRGGIGGMPCGQPGAGRPAREAYALGTLGQLHVGRRRFPEAESAPDQSLQGFLELGNQI